MTERTSKRWWKRPVTLVAGGVLLLVLLLAGAEIWIGIKIRRTIEREAAALTGGICRVEVRHARFNLFNRSAPTARRSQPKVPRSSRSGSNWNNFSSKASVGKTAGVTVRFHSAN